MDTCLTHSINYHIPVLNIISPNKNRPPALQVAGYDLTICCINRLKKTPKKHKTNKTKRDSQPEKLKCLFLLTCSVPAPRAVVAGPPATSSLVIREVQGETEQVINSRFTGLAKEASKSLRKLQR